MFLGENLKALNTMSYFLALLLIHKPNSFALRTFTSQNWWYKILCCSALIFHFLVFFFTKNKTKFSNIRKNIYFAMVSGKLFWPEAASPPDDSRSKEWWWQEKEPTSFRTHLESQSLKRKGDHRYFEGHISIQ